MGGRRRVSGDCGRGPRTVRVSGDVNRANEWGQGRSGPRAPLQTAGEEGRRPTVAVKVASKGDRVDGAEGQGQAPPEGPAFGRQEDQARAQEGRGGFRLTHPPSQTARSTRTEKRPLDSAILEVTLACCFLRCHPLSGCAPPRRHPQAQPRPRRWDVCPLRKRRIHPSSVRPPTLGFSACAV